MRKISAGCLCDNKDAYVTKVRNADPGYRRIMRRLGIALALPLMLLLMAATMPQCPITTTIYNAPTGSVSSTLYTTMDLAGGGVVTLNPVVGPYCYYAMTCHFPAGYVGTYMSYVLPDGSSADLTNFNGTFAPAGSSYAITGQASGLDSTGRPVTVDNVQVTMTVSCRSGRGGGCTKVYSGGSFTLTIGIAPPTPTPTPTPSPTPTPVPDS